MFKIPAWEVDIPENKNNFIVKSPKAKNKLNKVVSINKKQNGVSKRSFKTKNKFKENSRIKNVNNTKKPKLKLNSPKPHIENNRQITEETTSMETETEQLQTETIKNKKQRSNKNLHKNKNKDANDNMNLKNYDTDKLDELILNAKKEKLKKFKNDDIEENVLFQENSEDKQNIKENKQKNKIQKKKELLKSILQKTNRSPINISNGSPLRQRMLERLKAAKFRFLNEKLYTSTGSEAQKLFQADPAAFQTYHEGYQQQMKKWPVKPLDVIITRIQKMPKTYKIADMGCGEAELSRRVSQSVRSFDLVARANGVEECDIAHTPIPAATLDVTVYCLALMGTDLTQYLLEANRVLRMGGHLLIAEVESRFDKVDDFVRDVQKLGFSLKKLDKTHQVFFFLEFTKIRDPPAKKAKLPTLKLKPCIYKKR